MGEEAREHRRALESIGRGLLGEALAAAAAAGVHAESHLEVSKPVDLLIELADRLDARLIVVGSCCRWKPVIAVSPVASV